MLGAPELYGLAYVPRAANLVMNGYGKQVRAWHWGRPVAVLAGVAGLVLGGVGLLSSSGAQRTQSSALAEAAPLAALHAQVQASLPSDAAVRELQNALAMNDVLAGSVRVDQLLARLTRMAPPNVRLNRIDIARSKPEAAVRETKTADAVKPGASRKNEFVVSVEFALKGSYGDSKQAAELLVARLAELGTLEGTRFDHVLDQTRKAAPVATFSTRILLHAKALP